MQIPIRARDRSRLSPYLLSSLTCAACLIGGTAYASTLYPQPVIAVAGGPTSSTAADFNGDGIMDIAVAGYRGGKVSVLLGQGAGLYSREDYQLDADDKLTPRAVTAADMNGDDAPDIVVVTRAAGTAPSTVGVLLNQGDGTFEAGKSSSIGAIATGVASADVNGDGNADVVTADIGSGNVSLFLGNGDGSLKAPKVFPAADGVNSVALVDVNGDGDADVVTSNGASQSVSVLPGDGKGGFGAAKSFPAGVAATALAVGDVTGDGKADAVVANGDSGEPGVSVLAGAGNGTFAATPILLDTTSETGAVAIADLDGDDTGDIIAANFDPNASSVSVLVAQGDGTFKQHVDYDTGYSPFFISTADFDGDGKTDLITANSNGTDMTLLAGRGNGTLQSHITLSTGNDPAGVGAADVNGDGKIDIVASNFGDSDPSETATSYTISVFLNNGKGGFLDGTQYPAGATPNSVLLADVNGDDRVDVLTPNNASDTVSVLLNNGSGKFGTPVPYTTGDLPISIALDDVTGDGVPDLVVANDITPTKASPYGSVSVLPGSSDGTFGAKTDYRTAAGPVDVAVGDLNGDKRADIAVADYAASSISILINNGNGFDTAKNYSTAEEENQASSPQAIAIGDVNEDGDADVVVANRGSSNIAVFAGDGTGAVGEPDFFPTGTVPFDLVLLDYNDDDHIDVATANGSGSSASVLSGNGDGTFNDHVEFLAGANPLGITAADVNGDGSMDLVVANGGSDSLTVMPQGEAAPTARNMSIAVNQGQSVSKAFAGSDQNGDALTYKVVDKPAHGTVTVNGGKFTYTADDNYSGADSFTYRASDGSLSSNTATVSVTVKGGGSGPGTNGGGDGGGGGAGGPLGLTLLSLIAFAVSRQRRR